MRRLCMKDANENESKKERKKERKGKKQSETKLGLRRNHWV